MTAYYGSYSRDSALGSANGRCQMSWRCNLICNMASGKCAELYLSAYGLPLQNVGLSESVCDWTRSCHPLKTGWAPSLGTVAALLAAVQKASHEDDQEHDGEQVGAQELEDGQHAAGPARSATRGVGGGGAPVGSAPATVARPRVRGSHQVRLALPLPAPRQRVCHAVGVRELGRQLGAALVHLLSRVADAGAEGALGEALEEGQLVEVAVRPGAIDAVAGLEGGPLQVGGALQQEGHRVLLVQQWLIRLQRRL
mmetsp:Transcript_15898/g.47828  ORF Transcript_15898/g.47828 Transcript_15898/m.47828 type:complete len:254 (-) Transcript_15898:1548-2309(-)